MSCR
jgi:hypothetical protein